MTTDRWVKGLLRGSLPLLIACVLSGAAAAKETLYTLQVPESESVTYEIDLEVSHPGTLKIHAVWTGKRRLSLRVTPPDSTSSIRRIGLSPLHLETEIRPETLGGRPWKISIYALAARGAGDGLLTVLTPEPRDLTVRPPRNLPAPTEATPSIPPWQRPHSVPASLSRAELAFFGAVEDFRRLTVGRPDAPDACRWQDDMLKAMFELQDEIADGRPGPAEPARGLFERMAAAVETVDGLRTTRDPRIVGPPPEGATARENWRIDRLEEIQRIEAELDDVMLALKRGYAPELSESEWPNRMISCLTAAERHFEERTRVGENRAVNRDLAEAQWPSLVAAGAALKALAGVLEPAEIVTPRFRVR